MVSDLHLHMVPPEEHKFLIEPKCDTLFILGDLDEIIGYDFWQKFLKYYSTQFKRIYYLFGNHEYYNTDYHIEKTNANYPTPKEIEAFFDRWVVENKLDNVIIRLDETKVIQEKDCRIVGLPLWSEIPMEYKEIIESLINDYRVIYDTPGNPIIVEDVNKWHSNSVKALRSYIHQAEKDGVPLLIMTHHAPLTKGTSGVKYRGVGNYVYSTDLSELMESKVVGFWGFGHTHYKCDFMHGHTRIKSNPRGHAVREDCKFSNNEVVEYP
jgi:UDP-2,3-diacylglucosamine pyrophosphatase LpxH